MEAEGDHKGALEAYRNCLAIRQSLAVADPGNAGWQRDLSVNREKIGDVLVAEGDVNGALEAYRADLLIAQNLATADPDNSEWQRDLSISLARVADALLRLNKQAEALALAQQALAQRHAAITRFPNDPRLVQALEYYENLVRRAGGTP
jgi:tetratricopeptide (TPR) repeat protein